MGVAPSATRDKDNGMLR